MWFFDGSVTCYQGAQLGLFIVAVLVLIVGVLAVLAVAVMAYQKEISKWRKVCVCVHDCIYTHTCVCVRVCLCLCLSVWGPGVAFLHL